jgi:hypothetical protein
MAAKHKVTVSVQPPNRRPTSLERRTAQIALLSTKQAELKQEAAERRAQRANEDPPAARPTRGLRPAKDAALAETHND